MRSFLFLMKNTFAMTVKTVSFLILLFLVSGHIADSQTLTDQKHDLNLALKTLKKDKELANAGIGFYAVDINTGEVLSSHNENMALVPASVMKLVSTATALDVLGPTFRFSTKLKYAGKSDPPGGPTGRRSVPGPAAPRDRHSPGSTARRMCVTREGSSVPCVYRSRRPSRPPLR